MPPPPGYPPERKRSPLVRLMSALFPRQLETKGLGLGIFFGFSFPWKCFVLMAFLQIFFVRFSFPRYIRETGNEAQFCAMSALLAEFGIIFGVPLQICHAGGTGVLPAGCGLASGAATVSPPVFGTGAGTAPEPAAGDSCATMLVRKARGAEIFVENHYTEKRKAPSRSDIV